MAFKIMKIFLINFTDKGAAKKIAQKGMEIVYWTGKEQHFGENRQDKEFFSDTIFHSLYDTLKAVPASEVKDLKLDFPPKEIFDVTKDIACQVLGMISRIDFNGISHGEKMDLFYRYVIYWYGVLKHFRPDAVFFTDIPHAAPNYVIYFLSKLMGIRTAVYRLVKGMPGRLLFFDDFTDYKFLREAYEHALAAGVNWEDLSDEMQKYVLDQRQLGKNTEFKYASHVNKLIKRPRSLLSLRSVIENVKSGTFFHGVYRYFFMLQHKRNMLVIDEKEYSGFKLWWLFRKWSKIKKEYRQEYQDLQSTPDFKKKYIYVPLHFQPECNTNPVGGIFDDQILMIRTLSASLPDGWYIYIKESPTQWIHFQGNFGRYKGYYKVLNEIQNVRLVPSNVSTYELISSAQSVATLTGSAGLEALILSKPVLLFGFGWYMDCDGVCRVMDVNSCRIALESIANGYKPVEDRVFAFLHAVEKVTVSGAYNKRYRQFSSVSIEENSVNIANYLLRAVGF